MGRGDWKAFQAKSPEDIAAAAAAQVEALFTPERMEARLKTFELLTLASLRAQTDQAFQFIVLSSALMPEEYQKRLQALCDSVPQVILRFFPESTAAIAQKAVFHELRIAYRDTLQFRLDDDDCLCADFIALMKEHTSEAMVNEDIFVACVRDVLYSSSGGPHAGVYLWPVEFMSAGAAIRHPSKSIYEFGHFGMATRFPKVVIDGRMALVTHNGTNDTQFNTAVIAKRGMVQQTPQKIGELVGRNFPFLTTEAQEVAGLTAQPSRADAEDKCSAPNWYADLLASKYRKGFFIADDMFALQHTARSKKTLYVSFDNLSSVRDVKNRDPWGYRLAAKSEWSSLGVMSYKPNWFRDPKLLDELQRLAGDGFFEGFRQVVFTGTSMGAYAACAFSSLAPGCTVIAFSPQSTLDPATTDWDKRYPSGSAADWGGPFADAAEELSQAGKAWIVYDPFNDQDRMHAERLTNPNASLLKARYSGHFTAQFLTQTQVLGTFVRECVQGDMSEGRFYELYRGSRGYRRYLDGLVKMASERSAPSRRLELAKILRNMNKPGLAKELERVTTHH